MRIEEIEGIGPALGEKFRAAGIRTTRDLLEKAGPRTGRRLLAETTGMSESRILDWVNHADLMRLPGIGPEYSDLLEAAGVDSLAELAHRNPKHLVETIREVDAARPHRVRRVPGARTVKTWIEAAATHEKVVEH
jgi:predicted flap endonuclease-1-like 5' DNA nuclease